MEQGQFEEAKDFCQQALQIYEKFQDRCSVSLCLAQLGKSLETQGNLQEALEFYTLALAKDIEPTLRANWARYQESRVTAKALGVGRPFNALGHEVTGEECPEEIHSAIHAVSEGKEE